jgi:hypothetical protein
LVDSIDIMVSNKLFVVVFCLLVAYVFGATQCGEVSVTVLTSPSEIELEQTACAGCAVARKAVEAKKAVYCQLTCPTMKENGCSNKAYILTLPSFSDSRTIQAFENCMAQSQKIGVKSCICKNLMSGLPLLQKVNLGLNMIKTCSCQQSKSKKKIAAAVQSIDTLEVKAVELESKALDLENSATALEME